MHFGGNIHTLKWLPTDHSFHVDPSVRAVSVSRQEDSIFSIGSHCSKGSPGAKRQFLLFPPGRTVHPRLGTGGWELWLGKNQKHTGPASQGAARWLWCRVRPRCVASPGMSVLEHLPGRCRVPWWGKYFLTGVSLRDWVACCQHPSCHQWDGAAVKYKRSCFFKMC